MNVRTGSRGRRGLRYFQFPHSPVHYLQFAMEKGREKSRTPKDERRGKEGQKKPEKEKEKEKQKKAKEEDQAGERKRQIYINTYKNIYISTYLHIYL